MKHREVQDRLANLDLDVTTVRSSTNTWSNGMLDLKT